MEIPNFNPRHLPIITPTIEANDDLKLTSYRPSRLVWAGEQRRGVNLTIEDATSPENHVDRAMGLEFFLAADIPLPSEIPPALEFINKNDPGNLKAFWPSQLGKLSLLVEKCAPAQTIWDASKPESIKGTGGELKTVALLQLMRNKDLGGAEWIKQFTFGFPIVGTLSQKGVYPTDPSIGQAPDLSEIWNLRTERFRNRATRSGWKDANALWGEAMGQVNRGWLGEPLDVDLNGGLSAYPGESVNIAFRFGVRQLDKLRACDDLKHNTANLYCKTVTPIKLPTWDHIAQMCLDIADTSRPWGFIKTDHEAAYKQLPLRPDHARLAFVALRNPTSGVWVASPPRVLLFGAAAAVLRYNTFSRVLAVLVCLYLGIPLVGYFDDFGSMTPEELMEIALRTLLRFCATLGIKMKDSKTLAGRLITFLGLNGYFPGPGNNMSLKITLPPEKVLRWCDLLKQYIKQGAIPEKELESLIGKLSFSQTSVFGRMGRAMMSTLYQKQNAKPYQKKLTNRDLYTFRWWIETYNWLNPGWQ